MLWTLQLPLRKDEIQDFPKVCLEADLQILFGQPVRWCLTSGWGVADVNGRLFGSTLTCPYRHRAAVLDPSIANSMPGDFCQFVPSTSAIGAGRR
jgi:hypothetical protein